MTPQDLYLVVGIGAFLSSWGFLGWDEDFRDNILDRDGGLFLFAIVATLVGVFWPIASAVTIGAWARRIWDGRKSKELP